MNDFPASQRGCLRRRRVRAIRSARRSTELEGGASTAATRNDQLAYARGTISVTELGERVRRRYSVRDTDS
ncbi:antitoxin VbhA family protein [Dietzia aerolata]|uniref:Antitoxin VbhA domain-containing protein n=1 Tax=Dietzia aerolata TaxID=595984 RepID=A0ABV5JT36_9ACTN|nr:hypothetical protein [Dietzia aerolata]MBB0970373.1 antitoxin VbhA family protein [Dietzia aerolata]